MERESCGDLLGILLGTWKGNNRKLDFSSD